MILARIITLTQPRNCACVSVIRHAAVKPLLLKEDWIFKSRAGILCVSRCVLPQRHRNLDFYVTRRSPVTTIYAIWCLLSCFVFCFFTFVISVFISLKVKQKKSLNSEKFPLSYLIVHQLSSCQTCTSIISNNIPTVTALIPIYSHLLGFTLPDAFRCFLCTPSSGASACLHFHGYYDPLRHHVCLFSRMFNCRNLHFLS